MLLELYPFLFNVPFLEKVKQETVGVVIEIHRNRLGSLDIKIKTNDFGDDIWITFPNNSCTPYLGDIVEMSYKQYKILFFRQKNTIISWRRQRSNIPDVHNTLPRKEKALLFGRTL